MDSEYIVSLQKFDKKFFPTSEGPKVIGGGVIFSMVEVFSNFVLLVMRIPYAHRIYS